MYGTNELNSRISSLRNKYSVSEMNEAKYQQARLKINRTVAEELIGDLSAAEESILERITIENTASFVNLIRGQENAQSILR